MATKAQLAKAAADLKKVQANLAKAKTPAPKKPLVPISGVIPGFKPEVKMPTPAKKTGETGFVGPVANPLETQFIFNNSGLVEEVYATGPRAGTSVSTGAVVTQGPMPSNTTPARTDLFNQLTAGSGIGAGANTTVSGSEKYAGLVALLSSYGINQIADMVDKVIADFPEADGDEILNLLRYDARYNAPYLQRFSGNATRLKNKMPLLDEATYLQQEMGYEKMFKSYGLKTFANTNQYAKLIGAAISIDEATARVSLAYDRVLKADPSTLNAFRRFFPMLGNQDLVAAMLDPDEQLPAMERKVQSAEIGGAALRQGLSSELMDTTTTSSMYRNVQAGTIGAQSLETAGVSPAAAVARYQTIAAELPTMEKLSSIYGSTLNQYGQREAEQDKILGLASAKRKQDALIAREEAEFQGTAGTMQGSQKRTSQGQF
jgi:hypothetical protein